MLKLVRREFLSTSRHRFRMGVAGSSRKLYCWRKVPSLNENYTGSLDFMMHTELKNKISHTWREQTTPPQGVHGLLHLRFTRSIQNGTPGDTRLRIEEQRPPLRVIRAFPILEGGALVHLHNLSGGVLGGDQLEVSVTLEAGAYAQLTTTSATRLYRSLPHRPMAQQQTLMRVGEHSLLEYLPDPLIPFAGARYQQQTRIELALDAGLFYWEIVAPGRNAETFNYQQLFLDLDIYTPRRLVVRERLRLEPQARPLTSPARLGSFTYFCTFYICRVGIEDRRWLQLERELDELAHENNSGETFWGVSTLSAHGLVIRALSKHSQPLLEGLPRFWQHARLALYGRSANMPRKIY